MVSHERIYEFLREDKAKGGVLYKTLRHRLKHRKRAVGGKKVESYLIKIKYPLSNEMRLSTKSNALGIGKWILW
jgi:IS30 family transposase